MKTLILILSLTVTGCTSYSERFTKFNDDGSTNHVVNVTHRTFLIVGKAAKLTTETQTEDFIRSVNAEDLSVKGDAESIKALGASIGEVVGQALKSSAGIP